MRKSQRQQGEAVVKLRIAILDFATRGGPAGGGESAFRIPAEGNAMVFMSQFPLQQRVTANVGAEDAGEGAVFVDIARFRTHDDALFVNHLVQHQHILYRRRDEENEGHDKGKKRERRLMDSFDAGAQAFLIAKNILGERKELQLGGKETRIGGKGGGIVVRIPTSRQQKDTVYHRLFPDNAQHGLRLGQVALAHAEDIGGGLVAAAINALDFGRGDAGHDDRDPVAQAFTGQHTRVAAVLRSHDGGIGVVVGNSSDIAFKVGGIFVNPLQIQLHALLEALLGLVDGGECPLHQDLLAVPLGPGHHYRHLVSGDLRLWSRHFLTAASEQDQEGCKQPENSVSTHGRPPFPKLFVCFLPPAPAIRSATTARNLLYPIHDSKNAR